MEAPGSSDADIKSSTRPRCQPRESVDSPTHQRSSSNNDPLHFSGTLLRTESQDPSCEKPSRALEIILQPETRPKTQEKSIVDVKGIYAGLVMVKAKCIEVDNKCSYTSEPNSEHNSTAENE